MVLYARLECCTRASLVHGYYRSNPFGIRKDTRYQRMGNICRLLPIPSLILFQDEFTSLLLPILAKKLRRTVPVLLPHPSLLAHTIYQALAFDAALRDEGFQISLTTSAKHELDEDRWEGISEVILGQKDWFEAWVDGENKCMSSSPQKDASILTSTQLRSNNITKSYHPLMPGKLRTTARTTSPVITT